MSDARQEIQAVLDEEDAAWAAGDAAEFSARVLPDAVFTNIFGMQFVGHDAFEEQHARIFATIYKGTHCKQTVAHVRLIADDVAAVDTDVELFGSKFFPPGYKSDDGVLRARLLQVMVRKPEGWGIASFHNVVFNPPPMP